MADTFWGSGNPVKDLQNFGGAFMQHLPKDRDILNAVGIPGAQSTNVKINSESIARQAKASAMADLRGSATPGGSTPKSAPLARKQEMALHGVSSIADSPGPTSLGGGGLNTRPPRKDVKPTPTSVEQAYSYMEPAAYGGRDLSNLNTEGFIEPSAENIAQTGAEFASMATMDPVDLGQPSAVDAGAGKSYAAFDKSGENEAAAFTKDAPDLGISKPRDAYAGLRAGEKDAGLVYASGAYWADGDDGKLQKITMGMTGDAGDGDIDKSNWTASRAQALAYAQGRMKPADSSASDVALTPDEAQSPVAVGPVADDLEQDKAIKETSFGPTGGIGRSKPWGGAFNTLELTDSNKERLDPLWGSGGIVADRPAGPLW